MLNIGDRVRIPCLGTILGENINVISVAADDDRSELVAICQRNGRRYEIALLDIDIQADPPTAHLIAAYRRWVSA